MVKCEIVHLTPELAMQWREKNTRNFRNIKSNTVTKYANEIKSGNWKLNGETISFYEDGTLSNGQHRIEAVIKSGIPIDTIVVYGVENDVVVYDMQSKRTLKQIATAGGIDASAVELSTASFILNEGAQSNLRGNEEIIDYYTKMEKYFKLAYSFANKSVDKQKVLIKVGPTAAIYCAMVLNLITYEKREAFCRIVNSGMPYEYIRKCFDMTYQAIMRFNKQVNSKYKFKLEQEDYKKIIPRAKQVAEMMHMGKDTGGNA